jgi:superfamily II DNA or RNA helicase
MAIFKELLASFDADAGKRGKQFEHFVKWFLQNDPEWSTQVDQVWLWDEYPDRWGIDCGIDLVFRHKNGEAWAVQAKCYSQQHDITKHDVDKFLSESNRRGIDRRLLIATTDRIGANAKQVCDAQEKSVVRYLLSNFESANIEYPATLSDLHFAKKKPKPTPRKHQLEAIDAVVTSFNATDRGQLIMACGTGKTFTTLWIKEKLEATSTLILLPSLGLLSQTLHEWTLAANQPFEVLCVCSDDTVGKKDTDEAIHSITDVAFPVTSNVDEIRKFLRRDGAKVVFSTYQSSPLVAEAQSVTTVPDFDLAIADEAHRCAGKVGNDFTTILDAKLIRAKKRLFATATPRTYSTNVKKAAGERGIDVVGMDDEVVFGTISYSLPFGEAIKLGLLTDYQVVIIGVDDPTIAAWIENRELVKTETGIESDAESLAAQIGLLKAYKDYDLRRVISFHSRVTRAERFSKDLLEVSGWISDEHKPTGVLRADFVSGEMATDKRRIKLSQLKSLAPQERGLLTNARCLSEGVDVPSLDGVAFIDPRSSQIDIIQAVGRAIRLSTNKTAGTIILPVFIDSGVDAVASIEDGNFKPIWDVLNALKAHDDVLSAELDQLRTEMGRKGGSSIDSRALAKIHIDLPASVDQSFGAALRTYLVERVTDPWGFGFGALQDYSEQHGNCLVPVSFKPPNGYRLGGWVNMQRSTRYKLPAEHQSRLEALKGWSWNPFDDVWEKGYATLVQYSRTHGNCLAPRQYKQSDGYKLGVWISTQRTMRYKMPPERLARLEALKDWTWDVIEEAWEKGFTHLLDYSEVKGNCSVSGEYKQPDGYNLGGWVTTQRTRRDKMPPERQVRLEALKGWSWNPLDEGWESGFAHLHEYSEANGNCLVPIRFKLTNGYRLGGWVNSQRTRRDTMPLQRQARLEALEGWAWNPFDDVWENGYARLVQYSENHGHCLVPANFKLSNGYKLGSWVVVQRTMRDKMPLERQVRLEALKGWSWKPNDQAWESGYARLVQYSEANGNCLVPVSFKLSDRYRLGTWVAKQRSTRDKMPLERQVRLEALKGWAWKIRG